MYTGAPLAYRIIIIPHKRTKSREFIYFAAACRLQFA